MRIMGDGNICWINSDIKHTWLIDFFHWRCLIYYVSTIIRSNTLMEMHPILIVCFFGKLYSTFDLAGQMGFKSGSVPHKASQEYSAQVILRHVLMIFSMSRVWTHPLLSIVFKAQAEVILLQQIQVLADFKKQELAFRPFLETQRGRKMSGLYL